MHHGFVSLILSQHLLNRFIFSENLRRLHPHKECFVFDFQFFFYVDSVEVSSLGNVILHHPANHLLRRLLVLNDEQLLAVCGYYIGILNLCAVGIYSIGFHHNAEGNTGGSSKCKGNYHCAEELFVFSTEISQRTPSLFL